MENKNYNNTEDALRDLKDGFVLRVLNEYLNIEIVIYFLVKYKHLYGIRLGLSMRHLKHVIL
jgi:hypothetical protein